jgi:putative transposase
MPRKPRIIIPGYPHHLVQRGHNKQVVFRNNDDRNIYLHHMAEYSARYECKMLAYCLMQNHAHLLVLPRNRESLIKFNHGLGFRYARYYNDAEKCTGAVWDYRYFSSVVFEDTYLFKVFQYILMNPVSAGIVAHPWDYEWSSARAMMLGRKNGVPIEKYLDRSQLRQLTESFVNCEDGSTIQFYLKCGLPYASPTGYAELSRKYGADLLPRPHGAPDKGRQIGSQIGSLA